jgi:hypothetical protein
MEVVDEGDDDEDSEYQDKLDLPVLAAILLPFLLNKEEPVPQHDSILTGHLYYEELMRTRNVNRFRNCVRMDKETFLQLLQMLVEHGGLVESNRTKKITVGEKVMTFIHVLTGHSTRATNERWQHSNDTIHSVIGEVVNAILRCRRFLFYPPTRNTPLSDRIRNNPKFFPYFEGCVGAFDGSHMSAVHKDGVFRNRKGIKSQNVFASANFDMTFQYILVGWEGSAHDSKVYQNALRRGSPKLPHKYHLGDAGYALSRSVLTPYRGVRYHLKEWQRGNLKPVNKEELFNLRHASLRNVIERGFGVLKKRFPMLVTMTSYPFDMQCKLVLCCFMLHNFIRRTQLYEDEFDKWDEWGEDADDNDSDNDSDSDDEEDEHIVNNWRDGIAQRMWNDYVAYCVANGIA